MFKTRLLSGIILVIVLIITVGYGGNLLFGVLAVISLIGMSELYKVVKVERVSLGIAGYLAAMVYYGLLFTGRMEMVTALLVLFLVVVMAVYVFAFPKYRTEQVMVTYFGLFYVAVMLSYVYQTRIAAGRRSGSVADLLKFLGMRYLCLLCRHAYRKHKMAPK